MKNPSLTQVINSATLWKRVFWVYTTALTIALLWPNMTMPPVMTRPDLLGHYVAFGLLALFMALWNPLATQRTGVNLLTTASISAAYGGATELLQSIPILKRSAGIDDWIADVLGVACGLLAYLAVRRLAPSR